METTRFETVESLIAYGEKHNDLKGIVSIDKNIADIVSASRLELELLHALFTEECILVARDVSYEKIGEDESLNLAYYQIEIGNFDEMVQELFIDMELDNQTKDDYERNCGCDAVTTIVVEVGGAINHTERYLSEIRNFVLKNEKWMAKVLRELKKNPVLSLQKVKKSPKEYAVSRRSLESVIEFTLAYGRQFNLEHYDFPGEETNKFYFFYNDLLFEVYENPNNYNSHIKLKDPKSIKNKKIADSTFNFSSVVKFFEKISDNNNE